MNRHISLFLIGCVVTGAALQIARAAFAQDETPLSEAQGQAEALNLITSGQFAKVQVLSGGEFVPLVASVTTNTGGRTIWSKIPPEFQGSYFLKDGPREGKLEFRVIEPGVVIMACTTRWGGGGRGGAWQKEITTRNGLLADNWKEVGSLDSRHQDTPILWAVFAKSFKKGMSFSIRTEKYQPPILILKTDQDADWDGQPPDHVAPVAEKPIPIPEPADAARQKSNDGPPNQLKPLVDKVRKLQQDEIEKLRGRLEELEVELRTVRRDREKRGALVKQIASTKEQINTLKGGGLPDKSLNSFNLSVGQIGKLSGELEVYGVAGKDKLVLVPSRRVAVRQSGGRSSVRGAGASIQSALLNQTYRTETGNPFVLYGWPTQGVVDDQSIELPGLVEVFGTEQYGGRTIFALRWYDTDAVKEYLDKPVSQAVKKSSEEAQQAARTWKDATGQFSVDAAFGGVVSGNVQLEREDGSRLSVPMDQLSQECQKWIRERGR